MASLREYFDTDFPICGNFSRELQVRPNAGPEFALPARVYFCADAAVRFIVVYLPAGSFSDTLCQAIIEQHSTILSRDEESLEIQISLTNAETATRAGHALFGTYLLLHSSITFG